MKIPKKVVFITKVLSKPIRVGNKFNTKVEVNNNFRLEMRIAISDTYENAIRIKPGDEINSRFGGCIQF